jgi:putative endonuclease
MERVQASPRTEQQAAGDAAEGLVAAQLAHDGWAILGRNVRVGRREIDLVAVDPGPPPALVVVEVRWRRDRSFGLPEETVGWRKRGHLRRAALTLLERGALDGVTLPPYPLRVDLVVVEPPAAPGAARRLRHHRHLEV